MTIVFKRYCRYEIPSGTVSVTTLNTLGAGKFRDFQSKSLFILETVRDTPMKTTDQ